MTVVSPFAPFANSLLRFQVATGSLLTDIKTGNKRPGTAIVEVVALLEQKQRPKNNEMPGVDDTAIRVEGFLITPRPLPGAITPESQCFGTWQGRAGRIHLEFTARNAYIAALGIDLEEKIKGYFQFTNQIPAEFIDFGGGLYDFGGLTKNVGQLDLITAAEIVPGSDRVYVWDASATGANRSKAMVFSELENYLQTTGSDANSNSAEIDTACVAGQPVYVKNNGHLGLARADANATTQAVGLTTAASGAAIAVTYDSDGVLELSDWTAVVGAIDLVPGARYFLSVDIAGILTTVAPDAVGCFVVPVGTALTSKRFSIEIEPPIAL